MTYPQRTGLWPNEWLSPQFDGVNRRPRAADFSQDLQQELSSAGRRRSAMAAQGTLDTVDRGGWEAGMLSL